MDSNYTSPTPPQLQGERGVKRPYHSSSTGSSPAGGTSHSHGAAVSTMSRAAVSYPRKRAIAACQVCRGRKTKCDNERPTCGFCRQAGAICVYEGDKQATFDAASLAILDGIAKIQSRLDQLGVPHVPGQAPTSSPFPSVGGVTTALSQLPPIQQFPSSNFKSGHALPQQSLPLTPPIQNSFLTQNPPSGGILPPPSHLAQLHVDGPQNTPSAPPPSAPRAEKMSKQARLTAVGTTIEAVLQWPIFEGNYDADTILAPVFEDDDGVDEDNVEDFNTLDRGGWGGTSMVADEKELEKYDINHLIQRFLTNVQTKNPILDQGILEQYADQIQEHGFDGTGKSCIVLMVCALGAISAPYSEAFPNAQKGSMIYPDLRVGKLFFEAAKKRFGSVTVRNKLTTVQCLFLAGIYCMYTMQQFAAWKMFNAASVSCQAYLLKRKTWRGLSSASGAGGLRKLRKGDDGGAISEETQNFEKRVYWSCLKSEMEVCVELGTYPSGLSELRYPHAFPSPPRRSGSPPSTEPPVGSSVGGEGVYPLSSVLNASTSPTQLHTQSPATPATTISSRPYHHAGSTTENPQEDEITWFYYLADIALRKIERKVVEAIHPAPDPRQRMRELDSEYDDEDDESRQNDGSDLDSASRLRRTSIGGIYSLQTPRPRPPGAPTLQEMEDLIVITEEFEIQMGIWYSYLPPPVKFNDLEPLPCPDERLQYLRGRCWKGKSDLFRPFVYYLIHHSDVLQQGPNGPKVYARVAEFARKALMYDMLFILANVLEHRHHGSWLTLRAMGSSSLVYLAARKSGRFVGGLMPERWDEAFEIVKETLRYWGERMGAKDSVPMLEMINKIEEDWFGMGKEGL